MSRFRIDVTMLKPDGEEEAGLVDSPPGHASKHPTIFVSALCTTKADRAWFQRMVRLFCTVETAPDRPRKGAKR